MKLFWVLFLHDETYTDNGSNGSILLLWRWVEYIKILCWTFFKQSSRAIQRKAGNVFMRTLLLKGLACFKCPACWASKDINISSLRFISWFFQRNTMYCVCQTCKYPREGTPFFCYHDRALFSSMWQCPVLFQCDLGMVCMKFLFTPYFQC